MMFNTTNILWAFISVAFAAELFVIGRRVLLIRAAEVKFREKAEELMELNQNSRLLDLSVELDNLYHGVENLNQEEALSKIREKNGLIKSAEIEIKDCLDVIPPSFRHSILEGIEQPSEKGRLAYMVKLLSWEPQYVGYEVETGAPNLV